MAPCFLPVLKGYSGFIWIFQCYLSDKARYKMQLVYTFQLKDILRKDDASLRKPNFNLYNSTI